MVTVTNVGLSLFISCRPHQIIIFIDSIGENIASDPASVDDDEGSRSPEYHGRYLLTYTIAHAIT